MIGSRSSRASVPVPPAWSMCACVSQICSSVTPRRCTAASRQRQVAAGVDHGAFIVASHQTIEQFCWKGVTGTVW